MKCDETLIFISEKPPSIPRDKENNFTPDMIRKRQDFVKAQTGTDIPHISAASFDPASLPGNIENPIGAAQMPIGLAGPMLVKGEQIDGWVYVPMATTEGTLVASYSRGMSLLSRCGGIKATVVERFMQRAPVFHFPDARKAREFGAWLRANFDGCKAAADATTSRGKLSHIEHYGVSRFWYTRFNFTTGDAAGQNMCGKAAQAACQWIMQYVPQDVRPDSYTLSGAIDTDKKHSHLNTLHSRGSRVTVEATISRQALLDIMRVETKDVYRTRRISMTGGVLAGTSNNGVHAANGIAATFIATGQDAANVAESQSGITHIELADNGDLYWSLTLPSLIVASYGGGTGLATQRECLEIMGCYGEGKALRLAEIIGAAVLAGEISLSAAVVGNYWVESHDAHGRNRP